VFFLVLQQLVVGVVEAVVELLVAMAVLAEAVPTTWRQD